MQLFAYDSTTKDVQTYRHVAAHQAELSEELAAFRATGAPGSSESHAALLCFTGGTTETAPETGPKTTHLTAPDTAPPPQADGESRGAPADTDDLATSSGARAEPACAAANEEATQGPLRCSTCNEASVAEMGRKRRGPKGLTKGHYFSDGFLCPSCFSVWRDNPSANDAPRCQLSPLCSLTLGHAGSCDKKLRFAPSRVRLAHTLAASKGSRFEVDAEVPDRYVLLLRGIAAVAHSDWSQLHAAVHRLEQRLFRYSMPLKRKRNQAPPEVQHTVPARILVRAMGEAYPG